ncbi:hypothetical protein [Hymenobacter sp. DG01]|uniref:hypothetical protein n=1 Tax=Hymenobacter sp. DG01 TaxID=2584940 RepID=UPI0011210605|nr:hypothetical protein [Hymenobacter sp. DG01]
MSARSIHIGQAVYCQMHQLAGVIYDIFPAAAGRRQRPGCSVVLATGKDIGCFTASEADQLLQPLGKTSLQYRFLGLAQLQAAIQQGYFAKAWQEATFQAQAAGLTVSTTSY